MASDPPGYSPIYPCERTAYCFRGYELMIAQEVAPRASRLHMQLHSIFSSSEYSDLTIRTRDGGELKVHKAIVCASCDFFKNALRNGFKEAKTGVIEMRNDPPHAVRALVQFCYSHAYPISDNIFTHVEIYIVATTYMMTWLRRLAQMRFLAELRSRHHDGRVIRELVNLTYESLSESDDFLRGPVALYSAVHLSALLLDADFASALAEHDDFRVDVVKRANNISQGVQAAPCSWMKEMLEQASTKQGTPKASGGNSA